MVGQSAYCHHLDQMMNILASVANLREHSCLGSNPNPSGMSFRRKKVFGNLG
jgi:hypothetical protein